MPFVYMICAALVGTFLSVGWLMTGGALLSAALVYLISGNLIIAALLPRMAQRARA